MHIFFQANIQHISYKVVLRIPTLLVTAYEKTSIARV